MKVTVTMTLERETKGAVRYQEVNPQGQPVELVDALIGTLYIRKSKLSDTPKTIEVTVETEGADFQ